MLARIHSRLLPSVRLKHTIDYSKVPQLSDADLEEQFVRGGGPGGQSVNKTANCVVLLHKPTGIVVKCHETRSLSENRKRAREYMLTRVDNFVNKEASVEAQKNAVKDRKSVEAQKKREKLRMMKMEWKERENLE